MLLLLQGSALAGRVLPLAGAWDGDDDALIVSRRAALTAGERELRMELPALADMLWPRGKDSDNVRKTKRMKKKTMRMLEWCSAAHYTKLKQEKKEEEEAATIGSTEVLSLF